MEIFTRTVVENYIFFWENPRGKGNHARNGNGAVGGRGLRPENSEIGNGNDNRVGGVMTPQEMQDRFGSYEFGYWEPVFGSKPIDCLASEDKSESYEIDACHVFQLESGQFAVVVECGCSCYSAGDADIELHPTKEKAMDKFREWTSSFCGGNSMETS